MDRLVLRRRRNFCKNVTECFNEGGIFVSNDDLASKIVPECFNEGGFFDTKIVTERRV